MEKKIKRGHSKETWLRIALKESQKSMNELKDRAKNWESGRFFLFFYHHCSNLTPVVVGWSARTIFNRNTGIYSPIWYVYIKKFYWEIWICNSISPTSWMNEWMNEFSQTSLKGQGLLILEQGIARVCSIGVQVL